MFEVRFVVGRERGPSARSCPLLETFHLDRMRPRLLTLSFLITNDQNASCGCGLEFLDRNSLRWQARAMDVAMTCPALPCLVHRPCPASGINVLLFETRSNRAEYSESTRNIWGSTRFLPATYLRTAASRPDLANRNRKQSAIDLINFSSYLDRLECVVLACFD